MIKTQNENDLLELTLKKHVLYQEYAAPRDQDHEDAINVEIDRMDDGIDQAVERIVAERETPKLWKGGALTENGIAL